MQTVDELDESFPKISQPEEAITPRSLDNLKSRRLTLVIIVITVALGLGARVYRLDAAGFAEDETNKVFAIRAYKQGDFTANAEHPMAMKLLCYASLHAGSTWNRLAGQRLHLRVTEEAALRLPNAVFGALTVVPLFLLASGLLGFRAGLFTSLLWALGLDAIWFNRIAKEDTLLVFFEFTGFYLYYRAKQLPASDLAGKEKLFALAGASFGLMVASKYFPHYIGLNALFYTIVGYDSRNNLPLTRTMWRKYFGGMALAFVLFNPAVFFPQTWRYIWKYVNEEFLTHHGYLMMGHLYTNDLSQTPGGTPWYFYPLFIAVKLPLPVLIAFAIGAVEIFRWRGRYPATRGYIFLRLMLFFWLVPELFVGVKFLRYSLTLLPLIYMTAAVGTTVLLDALRLWNQRIVTDRWAGGIAKVTAGLLVLLSSAVITIDSLVNSYPSLHVNLLANRRIGYFFPHDEFYDLGARESVRFVAETAPADAALASEIPGVVEYYLERFDRPDIRSRIISQPGFAMARGRPEFVVLQPGRVYFENLEIFRLIENGFTAVQQSVYGGAVSSSVYDTGGAK